MNIKHNEYCSTQLHTHSAFTHLAQGPCLISARSRPSALREAARAQVSKALKVLQRLVLQAPCSM